MNPENLITEINSVFPDADMPSLEKILFSPEKRSYFSGLIKDVEQTKDVKNLLRILHQELSNLSSEAWLWILPHFLRYGLTSQAEQTQMEIEFFIYALSPSAEFEDATSERLDSFNKHQIECLIHFIEWCEKNAFWGSYMPEDLGRAKFFLRKQKSNRS